MYLVQPQSPRPFNSSRTAPLLDLARRLADSPRPIDARFDPDDFMDLSWCRHDRPPGIAVFKHVRTGRYLYLDAAGRAYRYDPPPLGGTSRAGSYRPHANLSDAIDDLGLTEITIGGTR